MLKALPVLILLAGILIGVYLVGQRTNILPKAQEQTQTCRDNPVPPPDHKPGANFRYFWDADCESEESKTCKVNADCPKTEDDPAVNPETSNWCYGFSEGPRCMRLIAKRNPTKTEKRHKNMEKYKENLQQFASVQDPQVQKAYTSATSVLDEGIAAADGCLKELTDECKQAVKEIYGQVKASYRLVKYFAVLAKEPKICVEADLGMKPRLNAHSQDQYNQIRRLFMCSGSDGSLKWRVKSKDGSKLIRTIEEFPLQGDNFPNKDHVKKAQEKVGT